MRIFSIDKTNNGVETSVLILRLSIAEISLRINNFSFLIFGVYRF